jgi:hypothetical protein
MENFRAFAGDLLACSPTRVDVGATPTQPFIQLSSPAAYGLSHSNNNTVKFTLFAVMGGRGE